MLTFTTTTMLRSGVARCGLQPALLRSSTCPYSTFAASPFSIRPKPQETQSPSITARKPLTNPTRQASASFPRRSASTTSAQQDASAAAAAAAAAQAAHPEVAPLDWNSFFRLRKTRRRWQLAFSVATGAAGGTAGALFLSSGVADPVVNTFPLDPFVTLGLMTFGFAALGWLIGPILGSSIFYALNRKHRAQMTLKEVQFFARIKKNRVDPSSSSTGNPVPDFYGEKIQSVAGYRQWLKDQRAFNKKRTTFV